ncbi:hypothetical protein M9Y10_044379 [Tritrichomonas musculus]|uniref:Uncharacterized protein n=1 Tax=Tritrichomonas musculus TaxID=1915356 RepID=A0ABR2JSY4_9EUKA
MDIYKTSNDEHDFIFNEELKNQNSSESFNKENPKYYENNPPESTKSDSIPHLRYFQSLFDKNSASDQKRIIDEITLITHSLLNFQLDDDLSHYLAYSNIIELIFNLLTNAPSREIYQVTFWLVNTLFVVSYRYQKLEIIQTFESFNLFDFVLTRFNPNYKHFLTEDTNLKMKIDPYNYDKELLPYYLHLLSFYCFLFDREHRDIILKLIILPNLDFFFDDLEKNDLIIEASYLIYRSTNYTIDDYIDYFNWMIRFVIKKWEKLDEQSQYSFLNSINNASSSKEIQEKLFTYHFQNFLQKYVIEDIKNSRDEIMSTALLLMYKLFRAHSDLIEVNYKLLIEIGISKKISSKKVAFALFREALKLRKEDSPLGDDSFFEYFMEKFSGGSFDIKYEFISIIGEWILNSSQKIILERAPILIPEITSVLLEVSVTDQLNFLILQQLKIFFQNAEKIPKVFLNLKEIFEEADGVNILEAIAQDIESPQDNSDLAQILLSYWNINI